MKIVSSNKIVIICNFIMMIALAYVIINGTASVRNQNSFSAECLEANGVPTTSRVCLKPDSVIELD